MLSKNTSMLSDFQTFQSFKLHSTFVLVIFAFGFEKVSPKKKLLTYPDLKAHPMDTSRHGGEGSFLEDGKQKSN